MKAHKKTNKPSHIVGIGASAGGLEALQALFAKMPNNLGVAYVVVQHLSSDFKSMMAELLSKHTGMPTHQAEEGEEVKANSVYLMPPGKLMRVVEGKIYLSDLPPDNRVSLPINEFFRSLAEDQQNHAIGILLSGTGSDGSRGAQALKEVGALVVAQNPDEAKFDGMPLNAINTGAVDFILNTQDMPEQIRNFINHPLVVNRDKAFKYHLSENEEILNSILNLVHEKTDLDFKAYKESTVARRIEHRMSINNIKSLPEYYDYLITHKKEIELIKQDLLIGVTQFFRDQEVWDYLYKKVITPMVLNRSSDDPIRVWCAGCSTGEEPYTIAMLFRAATKELNVERSIKVFASDIDQSAVAYAANGIYPPSIASEIPSHLFSNNFIQTADGGYQVSKELRGLVVFATHNLIQDPPFSNMDLVSCRNALIYLQNPAQQKAMAFFHFAIKHGGYLLLGTAETTGSFSNYFDAFEARHRVYKKNKDIRIPIRALNNTGLKSKTYQPKSLPQYITRSVKSSEPPKTFKIGFDAMLQQFAPPTLIFNKKLTLVYSYGDTSPFTKKIQPGHVTNDISDILRPDIVSQCISASHQVLRDGASVLFENVFKDVEGNQERAWSIKCFTFSDNEQEDNQYLALSFLADNVFTARAAASEYNLDQQVKNRIAELDNSLIECQKLYRETLEDLDTTREELQSSNEELMAANEELQSTNEELQSVNEELYTVNSEYQQKIVELTNINNDLENLLKATKLAVLFLDKDLKIRRYTDAVRDYLNVIEFDLDRKIFDLTFKYSFPNLNQVISEVNSRGKPQTKTFTIGPERRVEVSVTPYQLESYNNGVMVSIREQIGKVD
ncbi:signal transduction histidine kinase with CheB and CheR activity [Catenovulum agarivorans DS-2]|uniref:protein-glutamate O-methyltransferase n=1 Tax=Catenovulum agarivorans DS-2 TaxID=1328313 RepID=W7QEJ5_9ALTE|nr:chemotaxis protein CheB [Catenovulum agarivorans]EWH10346.1 signal transduction histidine kinase with CheB and CheR activity [Catenovulum agarivorans DS-2]